MIRKNENSDALKAGIFAIAMHVLLFAGMLFSFNWKAAHPVLEVTDVELWDKLPNIQPPIVASPTPTIQETPTPPVETPKVEEPKPEEPKVDIELENKKKELEKKELEKSAKKEKIAKDKREKEKSTKKIAEDMRKEDLQDKAATEDKYQDIKDEILNENAANDKQASAASASLIGEYKNKIQAKIRSHVNKSLCGDGNPELRFEINLLPTGELSGAPKITKSSGNSACDDAVERAIIASEPLPLPSDSSLFSNFRNLSLRFKPND